MMDEDLALALSMQFSDDDIPDSGFGPKTQNGLLSDLGPSLQDTNSSLANRPLSIVDESWEFIDPVPNIHDLFLQFNAAYFEGKLAGVEVKWSSRMTLCAGLCSYERRGGLCSIRLSEPLLKLRPRKDLVQTLLHEMIHALLFVTQNNKDHDSHGPEFHKHMYRINKQSGTNITVYHNFHDEVKNYRQHWWKCEGPCQKRPPFYGIVRRAMNRAPSKNDTWWAEHLRTCGGKFVKIKEPEDYGKKTNKRKRNGDSASKSQGNVEPHLSKNYSIGNTDISKWLKQSKSGNEPSSEPTEKGSDLSEKTGEKKSLFTGNGHRLGSRNDTTSRDQWLEKLIKKQQDLTKKWALVHEPRAGTSSQGKSFDTDSNRRDSENTPAQSTTLRAAKDDASEKEQKCLENAGNVSQDENTTRRQVQPTDFAMISRTDLPLNDLKNKSRLPRNIFKSVKGEKLPIIPDASIKARHLHQVEQGSRPSNFSPKSSSVGNASRLVSTATCSTNAVLVTDTPKNVKDGQETPIVINDNSPSTERITGELVNCPACPRSIPHSLINLHLDECLANSFS